MAFPRPSDIVLDDHWFLSHGHWNDRPIIVRGRPNVRGLAGHPSYKRRLNISWNYTDDGGAGMPKAETNLEMQEFEDRLLEVLESQNQAILVACVTHAGEREWIFYSTDVNESARRINNAFAHEPPRPLALQAVDDPAWAEFLGILENCGSLEGEA